MVCLACADAGTQSFNLPQLDLPRDQQVVAGLRVAATQEDLQAFTRDWRREGLPAKLASLLQEQEEVDGAAAVAQAGAATPQAEGRRRTLRKQLQPQQQAQAGVAAPQTQAEQD